ncbi:type I restriction enzyme, S subunit [Bacillus subtilis]
MSKKKKTIEELLEEALVSEDGQPFQVPENWVWTRLGFIGEIGSSKRVLKSDWKSAGIPFYRAREIVSLNKNEKIKNGIFISEELYTELALKYGIPKEEDLLITAVGTIGQPYIVKKEDRFYFKDASVIWFKNNTKQCINFINLFFKSRYAQNQIKGMSAGTTVDTYTISNAKQTLIPLPPLNEQKRIADKVERLLSKIEEAKQLIEEAKETFELRRAAILDKAFRGELTRKWRHSNGIREEDTIDVPINSFYSLPNGWKWVELSDILQMQNGVSKRRGTSGKPIPVLRLADITGNEFVDSDLREIMLSEKELEKYGLQVDDILFIRVNGSFNLVGKAIHFKLSREAAYSDHLIRGTFDKEQINVLYLKYLFESPLIRNQLASKIVSSAGQNTVSQGSLGSLIIPLPPKEEMDVIVRLIESTISKEETVLTYLDDNAHIESLKQSILSKAFRGELGTNDPSEENAIELLKEVLQEQAK